MQFAQQPLQFVEGLVGAQIEMARDGIDAVGRGNDPDEPGFASRQQVVPVLRMSSSELHGIPRRVLKVCPVTETP